MLTTMGAGLQMALGKAATIRVPNARMYSDFNELISQAQERLNVLNHQEAETVNYYLNQGLSLRNREVLQQAIEKAGKIPKHLLVWTENHMDVPGRVLVVFWSCLTASWLYSPRTCLAKHLRC